MYIHYIMATTAICNLLALLLFLRYPEKIGSALGWAVGKFKLGFERSFINSAKPETVLIGEQLCKEMREVTGISDLQTGGELRGKSEI